MCSSDLVPASAAMPPPSWTWAGIQALPSPGVAVTPGPAGQSGLWLQWQVTPLLWAWGLRHDVTRWRVLVVEPPARVGGSVEWHVSPDYVALPGQPRWGVHTGLRSWWPLHMRGDYLAASVGVTPQQDLAGPAQVSVHYAPEQVAGLDPRSLSMFRYDAASDSWKALEGCRSQPTQFRVECTLQGGLGVLLLGGAAPAPSAVQSVPWTPLAAGAGVLLVGGAAAAWRLRRSGS